MGDSDAASHGAHEEDDEDEYEDSGGANRLLGFMFGNVDCSGDLDVDYLDEDAKEHLAALADKLGPSLTEIDLTKSPSTPTAASEQDYDEKAEDAIDYEGIEEQYEGPEVQAATEEDHLLSKNDYFSGSVSLDSLNQKSSIFDEENYDEDEDPGKEIELGKDTSETHCFPLAGEHQGIFADKVESPEDKAPSAASSETEHMVQSENFQKEPATDQAGSETSLPVLCIEDGMVILRFSEIFGVHDPLRKRERRDHHRHPIIKECTKGIDLTCNIEEDEEAYLRSSSYDPFVIKNVNLSQDNHVQENERDLETMEFGIDGQRKDSCVCGQPMKEGTAVDISAGWMSPMCPKFYPLDQQDWEDEIVWGNSPPPSNGSTESCIISDSDTEAFPNVKEGSGPQNLGPNSDIEPDDNLSRIADRTLAEPFGPKDVHESAPLQSSKRSYHPQMLRLESSLRVDGSESLELKTRNGDEECNRGDFMQRFNKISLQNKDLLEGSWLDHIIWEPGESIPKPKLILDLQDEQMLFEILNHKDVGNLNSHAGAMIINQLPKSSTGDSFDHSGLPGAPAGRFNISNDKYYSNRKSSQQLKAHAKKRAIYGLKVHSVPALRLQTMKPKLSNKEIANFHRPKALWYPHDNKEAAKFQGEFCNQGSFKVVLKTLPGKLTLLRVDAEETLSSILMKASKKLDFTPMEKVQVFYSGKVLEDDKSMSSQNVRPNSVLHLVRTKIHLWPRAQKLPGENKPLRPPGAFKKKSDLSVKDGHVFLVEYCEERPLLLGNIGMGARLCTYYQKSTPGDQTASTLRNGNTGLGNILTLDPADKSPFLGEINPGCSQSSLETNMYRAPVFPHELPTTDYLLVRSAKGMLSLRRIDKIYTSGQQEPHMEVMSPGTKSVQNYIGNRFLVHVYREFRAKDKPGFLPSVRADELSSQFSSLAESLLRKRMKHCADLQRGSKGHLFWVMRRNFRIPSEEELRRMVTPENVCSYESMQAGLHRLKCLGIKNLTLPVGLLAAMNRLPDEAIALAAASHIERELQITSWNLSSNFVACTNQDRENIERLEITGVGDPSGRGLGFSYVRVAPKAPGASSSAKKKAPAARGGSTVTGTDADLRRLSMDAAREVLLKFNVPEENIGKMTRWHRIAMIRKLSSEQAASGIKVDATTLSKFARGQRMSFVQLQQQTREKCQEIWDRQVQSLSAAEGEENESDSEANSDLDSFAGDLENLLDAEEYEEGEGGNIECRSDKADGVKGLKMRRCPSQAQIEEEIEEDEVEAASISRLLDGDESEIKKKKKTRPSENELQLGTESAEPVKRANIVMGQTINLPKLDISFTTKEVMKQDPKEMDTLYAEKNLSGKAKVKKGNIKIDGAQAGLIKKQIKSSKDGGKVIKEKKSTDKPVRENFVCGACGQLGHMRTNKNCPKYGEELDASELENVSSKSHLPEVMPQIQLKTPNKKSTPKGIPKTNTMAEAPECSEKSGAKSQARAHSLKLKCGPPDKHHEKNVSGPQPQGSTKQISGLNSDAEIEAKSTGRINKIIISNKMKSEAVKHEVQKPSVVIRLPVEADRDQRRKKIIIKQPRSVANFEQNRLAIDVGVDEEYRKTKKIAELAGFEEQKMQHSQWSVEEAVKRDATKSRRLWEEEEKRRSKVRIAEERTRRIFEERRAQEEQQRLYEIRMYEEAQRKEMEEQAKAKKKKKKKKKPDFRDEYMEEYRSNRKDRKIPGRDRAAKRRPIVDLGRHAAEYGPPTKRRRGGEVILSNILESILDKLRENTSVSYFFLKPVTKKEAPDYFDVIKQPMDLSTIKEKVRRMEYKDREEFRHDVFQITYNAHVYNDQRNPGIPPLADQLLELCDYLLDENDEGLTEAEAVIKLGDT